MSRSMHSSPNLTDDNPIVPDDFRVELLDYSTSPIRWQDVALAGINALAELSVMDWRTNKNEYLWTDDENPLLINLEASPRTSQELRQVRQCLWTIASVITEMFSDQKWIETVARAYLGDELIYVIVIANDDSLTALDPGPVITSNLPTVNQRRQGSVASIVPSDFVMDPVWGTNPHKVVDPQVLVIAFLVVLSTELPAHDSNRYMYKATFGIESIHCYIRDARGSPDRARLRLKNFVWIVVLIAQQYFKFGHTETLAGRVFWSDELAAFTHVDVL